MLEAVFTDTQRSQIDHLANPLSEVIRYEMNCTTCEVTAEYKVANDAIKFIITHCGHRTWLHEFVL